MADKFCQKKTLFITNFCTCIKVEFASYVGNHMVWLYESWGGFDTYTGRKRGLYYIAQTQVLVHNY